jgi:phage terminase large subunit-like protein
MNWSTACPNWESRILKGESLITFPPLFPEYADRAWRVFSSLHIVDMPGWPTFGEVSRPWVRDLVRAIFGSYDQESGRMLIRQFFIFISKKNTKSTLAAGIMLTALILNWRDTAEFIILAPTVKIAGHSLNPAVNMCRSDVDEDLCALMHCQDFRNKITHINTKAYLNVVAADSQTVSGTKATAVFIDELHEFGKSEKSDGMILEATGGLMSRPEGFIVYASTQSENAPTGFFAKKLSYARKVRDGEIEDNTFLPILYEYPPDMVKEKLYLDPKYFYITNPNLSASVDEEYLKNTYKEAVENGPESVQDFVAKHLNVETGMVRKSQAWAGTAFWDAAVSPRKVTLEYLIERSEVIEFGCDGGGLDDLLGAAAVGRDKETGEWLMWFHAWAHEIALERRKSEAPKYRDFEKDGDLTIVAEVEQGIREVGDIVRKLDASGLLDRIGVDPSGTGLIADELENGDEKGEGKIDHDRIVGISQGWRLNSAIKTMEVKVASRSIIHSGSRMMQWCVGNARVEPKGNATLITKQASGTGKIDPLMAGLSAVALMAMNPEAKNKKSAYENPNAEVMTF